MWTPSSYYLTLLFKLFDFLKLVHLILRQHPTTCFLLKQLKELILTWAFDISPMSLEDNAS